LQQQLVQLTAEGQAKWLAVQEAEGKLFRLEAELEGARSKLGEANQKYRGAGEQITVLKQQVTQEETARQTAEQALAQASEESAKNLLRLEAELEATRSKLGEANQKYRGAGEQITVLKQQVTQEETARQAAEQALVKAQQGLQGERAALQQQLVQLTAEGQAKQIAADEMERKLLRLESELEATRGKLGEANQKYRGAGEQITALKQRVTQEESTRQTAEQALAEAQQGLQGERAALQQQLVQLTAEGQAKWLAVQEAEGKLFRLEAELEGARTKLGEANQKYRGANEQITALKQQVTQEETARQTAEQALTQATAQLEQTQGDLQNERAAQQQQLVQLTADGQAKQVAVEGAAKNLHRLEAELERARSKLGEANQKYRSATEQLVALKHQVTQEETARRAIEHELRHTASQLEQANSKYRQVTGKQIPELKSKLEQQKAIAERQLIKTRSAISFRLGYLIIHNFRSVNGVLSLPSALWALRKEATRRRKNETFVPSLPKPSPVVFRSNVFNERRPQEPLSNGQADTTVALTTQATSNHSPNGKLSIACIMDEFTFGSFQPEAILHQLTPSNWQTELEAANPDLLFIESAWRGKDDLWGNKVGHTSVELQGIVKWCSANKIPTVFWCKEDPIHFETFLNTATLFDYVFTTDIDCINRYKAALGHDRVYLLPFACQPVANNPVETYQRKDAFCFAGAYYVRYPERTRDLGDFAMELPAFRPLEIYDRNYGKNDPNYQFPAEYQRYIVGTLPFDQIDKAYKGYRYAINLNSIKQSQTMFARRVFELLASNTITISNFSRGLRLLFGDLVITSDSGTEIVRRLNRVADNEEHSRKLRLAGLRKVMSEHTYAQRLAYVVSKVRGSAVAQSLPHITVLAYAGSRGEIESIQTSYQRQCYAETSLYVVVGNGVAPPMSDDTRVHILDSAQAENMVVGGLDSKADLIGGMVAEDYYGPNYLEDIALATRYTQADLIGKAARYIWESGRFHLKHSDEAYHPVERLPARSAAIRRQAIAQENVLEWVQSLGSRQLQVDHGLAIDEFNYCERGTAADSTQVRAKVDDLPGLNTGTSIDELLGRAERIAPESTCHDDCPRLTGKQLAKDFSKKPSDAITLSVEGQCWRVGSTLPDGKHEYLYATADHSLEELGFTEQLKVYFEVTPGLNIQLVIQFLDAQKQKISHVIKHANCNQEAVIPPGTDRIRFGLRFYAGGHAEIQGLVLGRKNLQPGELIGQAEHLLLTNHYPSYDDLYRNGFVHSRVCGYREQGIQMDVFRLRPDEAVSYHEFEDVNVITASQEALHQILSSGRYKCVLVHFLSPAMWAVLQHHIDRVKVFAWMHGAEFQPWYRRDFDHQTEEQRAGARVRSDKRMEFWRELLQSVPANLKLVFVSRYFAEEVMEDLGFSIPKAHYTVIHNPINTEVFRYEKKSLDQRKKALSISSYASRKYATDLNAKAIELLSSKPWFYDMEFRLIGDGPLFENTVAPLRKYKNVYIEQRFLKHGEIAALHKEYGIFLCPTRWDSHGVSRDEAMSSGLVPVTNAVAAIPEFVDERCGIVTPAEDAEAMAKGISMLYEQPMKFSAMSEAAAKRVRDQRDSKMVIRAELAVVLDNSEPIAYEQDAAA
jgi:spore maturation protein CgeB/predicted  nucleic acid-binding Zn-ribbon protein